MPNGFDVLKGEISQLTSSSSSSPNKKIVVGSLIASDYVKTISAPATTSALKINLTMAKFTPANFDLLSRKHLREKGPKSSNAGRSNFMDTISTENSRNSGSLHDKSSIEAANLLDFAHRDEQQDE